MNLKICFLHIFRVLKSVHYFQKTIADLKYCSCFLEYSDTSYLKVPWIGRIERKSRLNNSWVFPDVRWHNKTLKHHRSMNRKITDWFLHTLRNREANRFFSLCAHRVLLAHIILTDFKCILFFLQLQCTGICASISNMKSRWKIRTKWFSKRGGQI